MSLKILSWNINGLRSIKPNMKEFLTGLDADIICFQETKVTRDMLEEAHAIVEGYSSYFSFSRKKSGYSGVVTYCSQKATPFSAQEGLSGLFPGDLSADKGSKAALAGPWTEEELRDLDSEGRGVITQHRFKDEEGNNKVVTVINVYCPRVDPEKPERREYKLRFYELMRQRAAAVWGTASHVVIVGDINCSHKRIDHCDPEKSEAFENRLERKYLDNFLKPLYSSDCGGVSEHNSQGQANTTGSCEEENGIMQINPLGTQTDQLEPPKGESERDSEPWKREIVAEEEEEEDQVTDHLLSSSTTFQMVDTFRYFYPRKGEAFTCWNVSTKSRSTNYGTRIDYIFCDEGLLPIVKDSVVMQDVMGSDHCPVAAVLNGTPLPSSQLPSCCTKFFPEFRGEQQKLFSYFKPRSASDEDDNKLPLHKSSQTCEVRCSATDVLLNTVKRKNEASDLTKVRDKKQCREKQKSISSFFSVKANDDHSLSGSTSQSESQNSEQSESADCQNTVEDDSRESSSQPVDSSQENIEPQPSQTTKENKNNTELPAKPSHTKNQGWGFLMKGPKPPPLCPGHKEPCVLQTVKKKGPNLNRKFYACARGVGKEGDPNARCNFFKWASK